MVTPALALRQSDYQGHQVNYNTELQVEVKGQDGNGNLRVRTYSSSSISSNSDTLTSYIGVAVQGDSWSNGIFYFGYSESGRNIFRGAFSKEFSIPRSTLDSQRNKKGYTKITVQGGTGSNTRRTNAPYTVQSGGSVDITGYVFHDHNYNTYVRTTQAASCKAEGKAIYKCACGMTTTKALPKTGHSQPGTWSGHDGSNHWKNCTVCGARLQTEAHSYGDYSAQQDYNENSHRHSHACTKCGYTEYQTENHTYGDWIIDKAATCSAKGSKHKICSQCGHRVDAEIEIDPSAHDYQQKDYDENGVTKAYKQKTCTHDPSHRDGERIYYTNKVTFSFEDGRGVTPKVTIGTVERKRGETVSANEINTGIMKYSGSGTGNVSAGIKAYPLQSNDVFQYPDANGKPYQVINKNTTVLVNGDVEVILHVNIHQLPVVLDLNTPNMYVDGKQTNTKVKTAPAYPKNGTTDIKELQVIPTTAYLDQNTQRYLKDLKPVLTDQTFQGWALDKEGMKMISSSTPFTVGESTNAAGKDVVYAIWAPVFPTLGNVTVPENGMIEAVVNYTTPAKYRAKYDPYKVTGKRQYSSDAGNDTKAYYTVTGTNVKTYTQAYIDGSSVLSIPGGQTQNKKYTGQPTITSFANTLTNKKGEFYQGSSLLVKNPYRLNNEKTIRVTGENNTGTVYKDVKLSVVQMPASKAISK